MFLNGLALNIQVKGDLEVAKNHRKDLGAIRGEVEILNNMPYASFNFSVTVVVCIACRLLSDLITIKRKQRNAALHISILRQ